MCNQAYKTEDHWRCRALCFPSAVVSGSSSPVEHIKGILNNDRKKLPKSHKCLRMENIVAWGAEEAEEDGEAVGVRRRWSDAHRQHPHTLLARRLLRNVRKYITLAVPEWEMGKSSVWNYPQLTHSLTHPPKCCEIDLNTTPHSEHSGRAQNSHQEQARQDAKPLVQPVSRASYSCPASRPLFSCFKGRALHLEGIKGLAPRTQWRMAAPRARRFARRREMCLCAAAPSEWAERILQRGRREGVTRGYGDLMVTPSRAACTFQRYSLLFFNGSEWSF